MNIFVRRQHAGAFGGFYSRRRRPTFSEIEPVFDRKTIFDDIKAQDISYFTQIDTIISEDVTYIGDVSSQGRVIVDGTLRGNMHCADVYISDTAQVWGGIVAKSVAISGFIRGNIYALTVQINADADVQGDIFHKGLAMEPKAAFDGSSQRADDPYLYAPKLYQSQEGHVF